MSQTSDLKQDIKRIADEVRLRLHLAGKDAKDEWDKLQPKIRQFETKAEQATEHLAEELRNFGADLKAQLQKLRDRVPKSQ